MSSRASLRGAIQKSQTEDENESNLLLAWHLELKDHPHWQRVREQIGEDVERCVGQVEDVNVDAGTLQGGIPGPGDRPALESGGADVGNGLAGDDAEHDIGHSAEVLVAQAGIEPADRGFDEAETG